MPRQRRLHVPGGLYHAVLRGNHRQAIFSRTGDYLCFEDIVAAALDRYGASVFGYCWMPNHVHLAIRIADAPLGAVMSIVASRYARARQRRLTTTGHLFERRYRARLVDSDRYRLALVRYIHLNPVRACIVARPRDYRWSSHRAYLGASCPDWLCIEPVLRAFGPTVDAAHEGYQRFMSEVPDKSERDAVAIIARTGRRPRHESELPSRPGAAGTRRVPRSLDAIAAEVTKQVGVSMDDILSKRRRLVLVQARMEIARRALLEGAANLSQVARYVGRSPSTLSGLLQGRCAVTATVTPAPRKPQAEVLDQQ